MTPRTTRPRLRASSPSSPAVSGAQPHRRRPTITSMTTSRTPPTMAASMVAAESTATVTRAPSRTSAPRRLASTTSFASSRSWPRPAAAMPSHSRIVAQVKFRWPASAWRLASSVHLCALTCGRRRSPGSAAAISARLCSNASVSTRTAGVTSSPIFIVLSPFPQVASLDRPTRMPEMREMSAGLLVDRGEQRLHGSPDLPDAIQEIRPVLIDWPARHNARGPAGAMALARCVEDQAGRREVAIYGTGVADHVLQFGRGSEPARPLDAVLANLVRLRPAGLRVGDPGRLQSLGNGADVSHHARPDLRCSHSLPDRDLSNLRDADAVRAGLFG